jgi:hypothetical protein
MQRQNEFPGSWPNSGTLHTTSAIVNSHKKNGFKRAITKKNDCKRIYSSRIVFGARGSISFFNRDIATTPLEVM